LNRVELAGFEPFTGLLPDDLGNSLNWSFKD
jgi:hypothetical protein